MKRGFTLVELLAVIVILAVIALITIPAVMKMIDNATMNSYRRSVDLYGRAVSQAVVEYQTDMVEKGQKTNITFDNIEPYIEYEGNDVDCKLKQIYSDKTILLTECYVEEELVTAAKNKGYSDENYYYYTNLKKRMKAIEYIKAVEKALEGKNISGTCIVSEDKLTCDNEEITIKSNLENALEGTLVIENNKVKSYSNLKFAKEKKTETSHEVPQVIDEENISNQNNNNQEKYATLVSDADNDGEVSIGDKYTYKVNDTDTFNFYVLSLEGDKVNLIMDRNICGSATEENVNTNGTVATNENPCTIAWHAGEGNNNYGPDTAMQGLYNATKNWTNVPNMDLSGSNAYTDENNISNIGYTGITTENGVATITGISGTLVTIIGTTDAPLKARLPKESEVTSIETGCHIWNSNEDYGFCNYWLVENLYYYEGSLCNTCDTKYEGNKNNGITNIYGYWLLTSHLNYYDSARIIYNGGIVIGNPTFDTNYAGLRAVITVSKSDLS